MSRSPVAKKRSSGEWSEEQRRSISPKPDDRECEETRQCSAEQLEPQNEDEHTSRSSNTSTVQSMLRRTSSSRGPATENSLRRSRRSSSYKEAPRPRSQVLDNTDVGHQSQPLGLPSPCRRGSHKKQRLSERSSPPHLPPETAVAADAAAAAGSPDCKARGALMEPPKTAKRGGKISSRVESPPPSSLEKPEAVPATDVPELAPEAATANDGPSQKDPVASPAVERKKPAPHTTGDSKESANDAEEPEESSKAAVAAPDFGLSGKLAAETNTVNGVVLKYAEPPEARKPKDPWRLYVFKDGKDIDMHHVDRASGYLFGRDRKA
ncbi:hypothetical protein GGF44_002822, partial [Coemansia sp. RSA 1694]